MILTTSEIKKFCDLMDAEYTNTTRRLIGDSVSYVRDALSVINDKWFDEVRYGCTAKMFNLSFLEKENTAIVDCLKTFGWRDELDETMFCPIYGNLFCFAIGRVLWNERNGESFWGSICKMDRNKALDCIVTAKKILKDVGNAYDKMFVSVNPVSGITLFDEFKRIVGMYYDMVVSKHLTMNGSSKDDEIRKMFNDNA